MKWPVSPLGEVATLERLSIQPGSMLSGTLYVGLENIESGGNFADVRWVNAGELASSKFAFTDRHLLYGKLRPYLRKVARPTFAGICSTDILPIFAGPHLDRNFLHNFLLLDSSAEFAVTRSTGANLPRISPRILETLPVPLPPLKEQRRIAAILDQAEALRAKRRQALAKLDTLTQSLFLEMFGDPRINSKGWRLKKLGEVCRLDRGISKHRPRNAPELLNGSYPLIQTGDVANCNGRVNTYSSTYSEAGLKQSRLWPAGTLCITIAANIAKTAVLGIDACFPDSVVGLVPGESMTIEFVQAWLSFLQQGLEESAPESAQNNINLEILRSLQIIEPPKSKQIDFSDAVSSHYAIRRRYEQSFIAEVRLSLSLQHRAFRGEL